MRMACETMRHSPDGQPAGQPTISGEQLVDLGLDALTDVGQRCLIEIERAGSAVMQRRAGDVRFLAMGEWLPFLPGTVLRLIGLGLLHFTEPLRVRLTPVGAALLAREASFWRLANPNLDLDEA